MFPFAPFAAFAVQIFGDRKQNLCNREERKVFDETGEEWAS
jgi:hypothetical protein